MDKTYTQAEVDDLLIRGKIEELDAIPYEPNFLPEYLEDRKKSLEQQLTKEQT